MAFILLALYCIFTARTRAALRATRHARAPDAVTPQPHPPQFMALMLPLWGPFARMLRATDADAIAIAMCAGTKTVALGIPIIQAVYEHNPAAGLLSLPLIIYHAMQILVGSLITAPLKRWVSKRARERARVAAISEEAADGGAAEKGEAAGAAAEAQSGEKEMQAGAALSSNGGSGGGGGDAAAGQQGTAAAS